MIRHARLKKTNEVVHVLGDGGNGYTIVVRPRTALSRKGNWGDVMTVRNDNLLIDKQEEAVVVS
jgi:hypothetical protein